MECNFIHKTVPSCLDRAFLYETPSGDYADNAERFGLFCRAVLDSSKILGVPDVFHIHGWPAGVLAILLRTVYYFDPVLKNVAACTSTAFAPAVKPQARPRSQAA